LGSAPEHREAFAKASADRRVILTFDLDYGEIVALSAPPSAGGP
jgi:hypothetical protein